MQSYSFKVRSLSIRLLGLLLAGCASTHLDDPSLSTDDSSELSAATAESGDEGVAPRASVCRPRCGDGRIDVDEDCEVGLPGWTSENCSPSCRQTLYPNSHPCSFELVEPFAFYKQGNCPDLPGFSVGCFYLFGQYCQILCSDAEDCPLGFTCNPMSNPMALGSGWCVVRR